MRKQLRKSSVGAHKPCLERELGVCWSRGACGRPPTFLAGRLLTCQVLSPWKKKKRAKPHTTEVQTMQRRGMSLIRSPLRSWVGQGGGGGEQPEGQALGRPMPPACP